MGAERATPPNGIAAMHVHPGHPDFLDLPWDLALARWPGRCPRIVEVQRGVSRHEVLFVQYDRAVYAVKELPLQVGEREYDSLRWLEGQGLPAVVAAGHARVRTAEGEASVLLTRFLDGSLPYRTLFEQAGLEAYRERLIDAMAGLVVRLHLAGFYAGGSRPRAPRSPRPGDA